jgi:hypothetical protein
MTTLARRPPLTPIFAFDAALAAGLGLLLVAFAQPVHALAGGGLSPDALRLVGLGLLPWAAHNWLTAREAPLGRVNPLVQIIGDVLWVLASLALCAQHWPALTLAGKLLYAPQIATVGLILAVKLRVYRRVVG